MQKYVEIDFLNSLFELLTYLKRKAKKYVISKNGRILQKKKKHVNKCNRIFF